MRSNVDRKYIEIIKDILHVIYVGQPIRLCSIISLDNYNFDYSLRMDMEH